jgi:hypothetical protein
MSKTKVLIGVEDEKVGFINLFIQETEGAAMRSFEAACKRDNSKSDNEQNDFVKFPEDFSIHVLGTFDTDTGTIKPDNRLICSAKQFYKPQPEQK